mgnify:CR=1 FL=1
MSEPCPTPRFTFGPPRYFLPIGAWRGLTRETVGYVEVSDEQAKEAKGPVMLNQKHGALQGDLHGNVPEETRRD